jgi:arylsulfatase A-like enzyme
VEPRGSVRPRVYTPDVLGTRALRPWLLAAFTSVFVACTAEPLEPARPHLILAVIDTLRADHLGAYGYARETSPFIDALAANGLLFERVRAQAPWTGASMASLWTSRHPSEVGGIVLPDETGVQELGRTPVARLRPGTPTLAQQLADSGYRTRAFVTNGYAGAALGLLDGFEVRVERPLNARDLVDLAIVQIRADLATRDVGPLFVYLHFRDAHEPLQPPEPYRSLFPGRDGGQRDVSHERWRFGDARNLHAEPVRVFRSHKIALYDGAIRFVDDQLSRLADALTDADIRSEAVFAIASDHGEAFWEHSIFEQRFHLDPRGIGGIGHGQSLFGELLDVPLILAGPGVPRMRVASPVRNLDLAPTLLGLARAPAAPGMRGTDLVRALDERALVPLLAFSENIAYGPEARSLTGDRYKLIRYDRSRAGPTELWFDLVAEPAEQPAFGAEPPPAALHLRRELAAIEASLLPDPDPEPALLDAETEAELRALGYGR